MRGNSSNAAMNTALARYIRFVIRRLLSHAAPSSGEEHFAAGWKTRYPAQPSAPSATTMNTGVTGCKDVRFTIQAPVMPSKTSTSGSTQHVDAMIDDATATTTRPRLKFFREFSAGADGKG